MLAGSSLPIPLRGAESTAGRLGARNTGAPDRSQAGNLRAAAPSAASGPCVIRRVWNQVLPDLNLENVHQTL